MIANAVRELNIFEREPWRLTPQFALYLLSIAPASVGELAITMGCKWRSMSFALADLATHGCVVAVKARGGRALRGWRPARIWHITEDGLLALDGCA
jgi:predicted ArsR family transcriptional regulator